MGPSCIQTLPFYHTKVDRPITEAVLERTHETWNWVADSQQIDPALGTLSYLQAEIRQMIFKETLAYRPTFSADGPWEYDHSLGPPFDLSAYYFGENVRGMVDASISGLRLVSSALKAEYEDVFLSERPFRFNDPESYAAFIMRLNEAQLSRVLSIAIGVCILNQMKSWLKLMAQLPPMLNNVHFEIYTACNTYFETEQSQRGLGILKNLVTEAVVGAPNAHISICGTGPQPLTPVFVKFANEVIQSLSSKELVAFMVENMH